VCFLVYWHWVSVGVVLGVVLCPGVVVVLASCISLLSSCVCILVLLLSIASIASLLVFFVCCWCRLVCILLCGQLVMVFPRMIDILWILVGNGCWLGF